MQIITIKSKKLECVIIFISFFSFRMHPMHLINLCEFGLYWIFVNFFSPILFAFGSWINHWDKLAFQFLRQSCGAEILYGGISLINIFILHKSDKISFPHNYIIFYNLNRFENEKRHLSLAPTQGSLFSNNFLKQLLNHFFIKSKISSLFN